MAGQDEAAQVRAPAADNPRRQWRHDRLAARGHPAFAPVAHHLGRQHQIAHQDRLIPLEAGARRGAHRNRHLAAHTSAVALGAAPPTLALGRFRPRRLLHPRRFGRLDWRPRRQVLQTLNLVLQALVVGAQRLVLHLQALDLSVKTPHFAEQRPNQPAEFRQRQAFKRIIRRQSHAKGESQTRPPANPTSARKSAPVTAAMS